MGSLSHRKELGSLLGAMEGCEQRRDGWWWGVRGTECQAG